MRVITGSARGKRLLSPEGMDVRPTPDKVKEGIFSALQFDIEGRGIVWGEVGAPSVAQPNALVNGLGKIEKERPAGDEDHHENGQSACCQKGAGIQLESPKHVEDERNTIGCE